jgi:hypothetical protein
VFPAWQYCRPAAQNFLGSAFEYRLRTGDQLPQQGAYRMKKRGPMIGVAAVVAAAAVFVSFPSAVHSQNVEETSRSKNHDPFSWTKGYRLFVTNNKTIEQANDAVDFISSKGGQVAIVVSPRMMLGYLPENASVVGSHGIVAVHDGQVGRAAFTPENDDEVASLDFYNEVVTGAWRAKKQNLSNHTRIPEYKADALELPKDSARAPSILGEISGGPAPAPGNSDMMVGRVNMNIIFVESTGAIDPNLYSWTCADLNTIVSEISAGQSFWSSRAAMYGVPLTWYTVYYRPPARGCLGTTRVFTSYEPILHAQFQDGLWIEQIMCNFGFCGGNKFARTDAFNSARRIATGSNWATTSFVGYNPAPAPTTFTDGYFAYAYRSGNYSQLLYRNDGWAVSQYDLVHAHETGHLFGAFDEYASSNCSNCFNGDIWAKNVVNGNCAGCNGSSTSCIMRHNELALCGYTPGQVGWGLDINYVRTMSTVTGAEKTNWKAGQPVRYLVNLDIPGRPGECVDVSSRWYRQFQANVTESEAFVSPCLVRTGGNWNIWLDRAIPAGASFGEGSVEVQLELKYPSLPNNYGKGVRASARGRVYVLNSGANQINTLQAPQETAPPKASRKVVSD